MARRNPYPLVEVLWTDAATTSHSVKVGDIKAGVTLQEGRRTAGYLLPDQGDEIVRVAHFVDLAESPEEDAAEETTAIPSAWVQKIIRRTKGVTRNVRRSRAVRGVPAGGYPAPADDSGEAAGKPAVRDSKPDGAVSGEVPHPEQDGSGDV